MTRVPTQADLAGLAPDLVVAAQWPDPPASTTAILLLFHGFGDDHEPFAAFARALRLPGVLALAVRGPHPVPFAEDTLLEGTAGTHFHWGDDLQLRGDGLDPDPGFDRALDLVAGRLVDGILVGRCGWRHDDLLLFGFGQGGTFALALAARLSSSSSSSSLSSSSSSSPKAVIAIAPAIPAAMDLAASDAPRIAAPLLVCGPAESDAVDEATLALLRRRFVSVEAARWTRRVDDDAMPRNRAEMLPLMQFLLPKLRAW